MSLTTIVQTLGGDLYDRGRRANIPAPGHSKADRSVSLLLENGRVVVHTFGGGDWREVLDDLRERGLIDAGNAPLSVAGARLVAEAGPATRLERRDTALELWGAARPLPGTLSERYCRSRGLVGPLPGAEVLRHHPAAPVSVYRQRLDRPAYVRPALLAAILGPDGRFLAVEVSYLTAQGRRSIDLRLNRKTVGPTPGGCAIRLDAAAEEMLVGEGVFTTRSASEWFGLPGWALMSTRNLRAWRAPEGVRSVLITADRGADGEASAEQLRGRLAGLGVAASVALPPGTYGDWNQWSASVGPGRRGGEEEGRAGSGAPGGRMALAQAQEPDAHDRYPDSHA